VAAVKTERSLDNACHTSALLWRVFLRCPLLLIFTFNQKRTTRVFGFFTAGILTSTRCRYELQVSVITPPLNLRSLIRLVMTVWSNRGNINTAAVSNLFRSYSHNFSIYCTSLETETKFNWIISTMAAKLKKWLSSIAKFLRLQIKSRRIMITARDSGQ